LTIASFFFGIFSYYAYAFLIGTILIENDKENSNSYRWGDTESITFCPLYNAGDIISCFFGVVFGVFSLGMATPNIKAVTEGRVAGKMAYDIIER
jgi:hypothetical protein